MIQNTRNEFYKRPNFRNFPGGGCPQTPPPPPPPSPLRYKLNPGLRPLESAPFVRVAHSPPTLQVLPPTKIFIENHEKSEKRIKLILYFLESHNTSCLSPKIWHNHCFGFLLGHRSSCPKRNRKQCLCQFSGGKRGVLWDLGK